MRAERFHRTHTLRRVLAALLDHVTWERLAHWDSLQQAQEHSDRSVYLSVNHWDCLQQAQEHSDTLVYLSVNHLDRLQQAQEHS